MLALSRKTKTAHFRNCSVCVPRDRAPPLKCHCGNIWSDQINCTVLMRWFSCSMPPTPTNRHTCSHPVLSSSLTAEASPSLLLARPTQVLSTIGLFQLIDSYTPWLIGHFCVIVLRCFGPDLKITSRGIMWHTHKTSHPREMQTGIHTENLCLNATHVCQHTGDDDEAAAFKALSRQKRSGSQKIGLAFKYLFAQYSILYI